MLHRIVIAIFLFETIFVIVTGLNVNIFNDQKLLLFNILFVLWLFMESMRVPLGHDDNNAQTFGKFSRSFLIISFVSIFIAAWERTIAPIPTYSLPTYSTYIGLIIFFIGVYLRHLSIKHLGKYFVTKVQVTDDHKLVTNGIYSSLRHPSYTGLILGFLGIILFLQAGLATAIFVLIALPAYLYRIKVEEHALIKTFGEQYKDYQENSYALLPLVY